MISPRQGHYPNGYLSGKYENETRPESFSLASALAANGPLAPWMLMGTDDDHSDDDHGDDHGDEDQDGEDHDDDHSGVYGSGTTITKTVSQDSASTGSMVYYTITIVAGSGGNGEEDDDDHGDNDHNESSGSGTSVDTFITNISDNLPGLFTYVPGSTVGLTVSDPVIQNNTLTWNGPWFIPSGQTVTLTFAVNVGLGRGNYQNSAAVLFDSGTALSTGLTAPVQVIGPQLILTKSVDKFNATPGDTLTYTVYYTNGGDDKATSVFILESVPDHTQYLSGTAQGLNMNILFSQDNGMSYGTNQTNVTDISFQRLLYLLPGETGFITFQVIVK